MPEMDGTASPELVSQVFDKTRGFCTYCGTGLVGSNCRAVEAGAAGPGAWEIERWEASADIDPVLTLWPVCCSCTMQKGASRPEQYILRRWQQGLPIFEQKWRLNNWRGSPPTGDNFTAQEAMIWVTFFD